MNKTKFMEKQCSCVDVVEWVCGNVCVSKAPKDASVMHLRVVSAGRGCERESASSYKRRTLEDAAQRERERERERGEDGDKREAGRREMERL